MASNRKPLLAVLAVLGALLACTATPDLPATPSAGAAKVLALVAQPPVSGVVQASGLTPIATPTRHSAFPSIARRPDGKLTAVWRGATDHEASRDGRIYRAESSNEGQTWTPATLVPGLPAGKDLRDPSISYIGDHQYLTFFTGANGSPEAAAGGAYVSRDGRPAVRIDPSFPLAAISAPVVLLPDGRLATAFYGWQNGESMDTAWMAWSSDLGDTWKVNRIINSGIATPEPVLVVDGSNVHMFARWGTNAIAVRTSTNSGNSGSWGSVRVVVTDCTGRPSTYLTQAGTLVMMCRGPLSSGPHAKIVYSLDHAGHWNVGPTVMPAPSGAFGMTYAGFADVKPTGILAVFGMQYADGSGGLYATYLAESR